MRRRHPLPPGARGALQGVAVQAKEPERDPSHPSIEMRQMPPIVAAVPLPAGMQPYQAQPGQPPQMVPAGRR